MIEALPEYNSIGMLESDAAATSVAAWPLSGYLGGEPRGGYKVQCLEGEWAQRFGVKHAIACNSATSGLLAAAHAVGLGRGDSFICSPLTMSATAAAPAMTGARPLFIDVDPHTLCLDPERAFDLHGIKAVVLTHLFGRCAYEAWWAGWCGQTGRKLIVDAAQAPFAREAGKLAGTQGDIGVYSLNVHKHIQCGEGGIVVTNDDHLAEDIRRFINHSEMFGGPLGLNLRMTEVTASIARIQLRRAHELIGGRVDQALTILSAIGDIPGLRGPLGDAPGSRNVFYTIPFVYDGDRAAFVAALRAQGVPLVAGYVDPLYRLPAFSDHDVICREAEDLHDRTLFYFENCRYSPTPEQIRQIGDAFKKVADAQSNPPAHPTVL